MANRAPDDVRYRRAARRMLPLIRRTDTLVTKATVPGPDGDKPIVAGMAFWHLPGAAVDNLQKRKPADEKTEEEREAWEQVDWEKWNGMLEKYDVVRRQVMGEEPHWCAYLPPLRALPSRETKPCFAQVPRTALDTSGLPGSGCRRRPPTTRHQPCRGQRRTDVPRGKPGRSARLRSLWLGAGRRDRNSDDT